MGKRKPPYDHDFWVRTGRKGGKIGGKIGGKRSLETMTPAARTARAYQGGVALGRIRRMAMLKRADQLKALLADGLSVTAAAKRLQVSISTAYRLAREAR